MCKLTCLLRPRPEVHRYVRAAETHPTLVVQLPRAHPTVQRIGYHKTAEDATGSRLCLYLIDVDCVAVFRLVQKMLRKLTKVDYHDDSADNP